MNSTDIIVNWNAQGKGHKQHWVSSVHSVTSSSATLRIAACRLPCSSPTPGAYSNPHPPNRWCHATISSSVVPFSSYLQSFLASGSFPRSQLFTSGGQSIGASASVLAMNIQSWFPLGLTGLISLLLLVAMVAAFSFRESRGSKSDHTLLSLSL